MEGAAQKTQNRRYEIWMTAMLPHLKEPPSLEKFTGIKPDRRAEMARCVEAWDKVDRALMANKKRG